MLYTSRYANHELDSGAYYTVGISWGRPKFRTLWKECEHCYALAPPSQVWGLDAERFRQKYREHLDGMGRERIRTLLEAIRRRAGGKDVVLLCFEDVRDPAQFCHRRFLGEWLQEQFDMQVPELHDPGPLRYRIPPRKEDPDQLSLF